MSVRTSPTAGSRSSEPPKANLTLCAFRAWSMSMSRWRSQCVTIDRNHHRAVEAPGPCSSPWQTGPPDPTNRPSELCGRSPGSMFQIATQNAMNPEARCCAVSPHASRERIAKPAERARRLAGVLFLAGRGAIKRALLFGLSALLLDCAPLSGHSPPKLPRTTWMLRRFPGRNHWLRRRVAKLLTGHRAGL